MPLDPGREWLAAGITGLQRQREWDAVATVDGDGTPVGAVGIDVGRLEPEPRGDELELTWNGSELELTIDDVPAEPTRAAALERLANERVDGAYAAHAHRLRGDLWELSVLAL